jgi:Lrp/AsnC family transcriptional regulator
MVDRLDRKILQILQEDATVAILDPTKVNTKVTAFVAITTNQHNEEWLRRFAEVIQEMPEVVEFYRMAGQVDYLLRVVVPDIEAFDAFYKRLIAKIDISDVSTTFAMEQIKYTTAVPLSYIAIEKERAKTVA